MDKALKEFEGTVTDVEYDEDEGALITVNVFKGIVDKLYGSK
ncbi:hypothetical protein [Jeotgalicoccus halotolerans]|uniref:Uncharacterized protein n=1 Tax=Jeotgalicoccus halotolerans TaxID=157227 RepID=A0A3E0AYG6_9STAP|nr:hypothetical protein [Jeotgalicoccus halotolerans]REG24757.1 hypothetical protein DFR63_1064 [Jeotgalicoccus halotolerans]